MTEAQRGADLSIALQGPDGKTLVENSQASAKGVKEIFWIAGSAGDYQVTIRLLDKQPATGSYDLELRNLRVPLPEDRTRFSAFLATSQATDLLERRAGTAASLQQAVALYRDALPMWQAIGNNGGKASSSTSLAQRT
ncbi:MAG: hypothetical protein HYX27_14880 [Acidobacteria bacterium]|nr:hypothetical protein [Acidobacteriota bacterium]